MSESDCCRRNGGLRHMGYGEYTFAFASGVNVSGDNTKRANDAGSSGRMPEAIKAILTPAPYR